MFCYSSQNRALCTRGNKWIFLLGKKEEYERKNICTGSKMSIFSEAVQQEVLGSHYLYCSWNILESVTHGSAKLFCKVMSNTTYWGSHQFCIGATHPEAIAFLFPGTIESIPSDSPVGARRLAFMIKREGFRPLLGDWGLVFLEVSQACQLYCHFYKFP